MLRFNQKNHTVEKIDTPSLSNKDHILWCHFAHSEQMELEELLLELNVHPLAKKAMSSFSEVPRVDIYQQCAFISAAAITEQYSPVRISMLAGEHYVITRAERNDIHLFQELEEDFHDHPEHMSHPGHILYHIMDKVSMFYLKMVDRMADEIQQIEKQVFISPFSNEIGHAIYRRKGKLHELRQFVESQENVIKTIGRSDFPYINEDAGFYMQDLQENFSRVVSAFDTFKEDLARIFDLQMSLKSDHMNEIMKTLTLASVVFLPMTFIAGLYGMNFETMPELKWKFGYAYGLILMFGLGGLIALYFRKKGWWGDHKPKMNQDK